jgi:membrane glycosyltransferase
MCTWQSAAKRRKLSMTVLIFLPTALIAAYLNYIFSIQQVPLWLRIPVIGIYAILFAFITTGFLTGLAGFYLSMRGVHAVNPWSPSIAATTLGDDDSVAVLMPIYNEDVARVFAGLATIIRSLQATADYKHFRFFVLSDTRDPQTWLREEMAVINLCKELDAFGHIHYRRRPVNNNAKTGNVSDFCRRWGKQFRYMLVLDADSIMLGETLSRLLRMMVANPKIGIIQTQPVAVLKESLYARMMQFASRLYGPIFSAGLQFLQIGDGHYIGHNAILRTEAFCQFCTLPILPGRKPWGGRPLSHDFVEAAFMARFGWEVWYLPELEGSFEEVPPTIIDDLKRERRWAQGNIQHLSLLFGEGLKPAHRFLFVNGAMAFLTAPLWGLFILFGILWTYQWYTTKTPGALLIAAWTYPLPPWWLFGLAIIILILPKILSIIVVLRHKKTNEYGGFDKLVLSVMLEIVLSTLLAPILMLYHSLFVFQSMLNNTVKWSGQVRDDKGTHWIDAIRTFWWCSAIGVGLWFLIYRFITAYPVMVLLSAVDSHLVTVRYIIWLVPILGGMIFSIPIAVLTSRPGIGNTLKKRSLFIIPEEASVPNVLIELRERIILYKSTINKELGDDPFVKIVTSPSYNAVHAALQRERIHHDGRLNRMSKMIQKALENGPESLSMKERNTILLDRKSISDLHWMVWSLNDPIMLKKWNIEIPS